MRYLVFTDGGSRGNPGPAAAAYVIKLETGEVIEDGGVYLGTATNNHAEYEAVKQSLIAIEKLFSLNSDKDNTLHFFLDSKLVVEQLMGNYKIKNQNLAKLAQVINNLLKKLDAEVSFTHIPRAQNSHADALVNQVLDAHA